MIKSKMLNFTLVGILAVGIGGTGASIFAAANQDEENQFQEIKDQLNAHGIELPSKDVDQDEYISNLDPAVKEKIKSITGDLKAEELSADEALELRKQRVTRTSDGNRTDKRMNIDEDVKAQAKGILEAVLRDNKSVDDAIAELTHIGITLSDQEVSDLHMQFNNDLVKENFNKQKDGNISRDMSREGIMEQRIGSETIDEE